MAEVEAIKRRWERKDTEDIDSAITALLQAPNGRRFLWWLMTIGKVGNQPFSPDPAVTAFTCGELNVGNQIMAKMTEVSPDLFTAMQKEMFNERNNRDRELAAALDRDRAGTDLADRGDAGGDEDGS